MLTKTTIAFTGDSHFDSSPNGRLEECVRLHEWMIQDWATRGVHLVLHGGDLFEGLGSTTSAERMAAALFLQAAAARSDVLVVRGNHDPLGELPLYERLSTSCGAILVAEDVKLYRFEEADVEVVAVPWPRKGLQMADAGVGATANPDVRGAIQDMMRYYGALPRRCSRRLVVAHAMIAGATTSTGQPLVGADCEISVEDLALAEPDMILLSHVHKGQRWRVAAPSGRMVSAFYAGSNRRTDFGELETKEYLLIERQAMDAETTALMVAAIEIPATPLLHWDATWDAECRSLVHAQVVDLSAPAEARLRVAVPSDQRDAVRQATAAFVAEAALRQVAVTVEEVPVLVSSARAAHIAEAKDVTEKLAIAWTAKGVEVTPERRERVFALAREIDGAAGRTDARGRRGGGIRLLNVRGTDLGPYKDFALDLEKLRGPIVALHGSNGAGKSTFLELAIPALCYRQTITRDPLLQLATSKRSTLAGEFEVGGRRFHAIHLLDKANERAEASVTDDTAVGQGKDGCRTPGGKVSEFDAWAERELPPFDVFEAAQFAAQGRGGLLGMGASKRKDLIQKALGIDGIEARAQIARGNLDEAKKARDLVAARVEELRRRAGDVAALEKELEAAAFHVELVEGRLKKLGDNREQCEMDRAYAAGLLTEWSERNLVHQAAQNELANASAARVRAQDRLREAADAARRLPAHADARERRARLNADIDKRKEALAALREGIRRFEADAAGWTKRIADARRAATAAETNQRRAVGARRDAEALRLVAADLDGRRTVEEEQRLRAAVAEKELLELTRSRREFGHERATKLRGAHEQISVLDAFATADAAVLISRGAIAADDAGLKLQTGDAVAEAERAALDAKAKLRAAGELRATAERAKMELERLGDVEADERSATDAWNAAQGALEEIESRSRQEEADLPGMRQMEKRESDEIVKPGIELREVERSLEPAVADERLAAEHPARRDAIEEALAAEDRAKAALPPAPGPRPASGPAESVLKDLVVGQSRAASERDAAVRAREQATAKLDAARDARTAIDALEKERAAATELIADLALLAETFGRDGIQALEVDAAGPELSAIANELLELCAGGRWRVRLETTRPLKRDPTRSEEVFSVISIDTHKHVERDAKSNSGGEKVPIGEALSFALTVIACRRSAVDRPTLVRDESGAALDPENAKGYIAMLRRAAQLVGADHVLLVSHNPAVWALADSRVRVGEGAIHVE